MQLGRLGAWYSTDKLGGPRDIKTFVQIVEQLGYDTLWLPESRGYESLSVAGFMLSHTSKLKLGSSIASIYARDAFTSRRGLLSLQSLYGDRFILGLGVSHVPMVEGIRGHTTTSRCRRCAPISKASQGQSGLPTSWPLALAALGPLMLKLSASHTRGALPYNATPQHTAEAERILGPNKWLAAEQKVTIETDPTKARALGRKELSRYMVLDNYRNNWLRIGFPRPISRTADRTASSMRWCCGAPPARCAKACARISPPARRMFASSRCTRTAIPRRVTAS